MISRTRAVGAVTAALALLVTATTVEAQETPVDTETTTQECKALAVLVPVPSGADYDLPTTTATGIFADVVGPVLADDNGADAVEPIFIPYKARGLGEAGEVYSQTLTDGYARLTQVAYRVVQQCPQTQLALLGQGQAGHLISYFAAEVGKGKLPIKDSNVAFAATISDPTRAPGASVFPGAPGLSAPQGWGKVATTARTGGRSMTSTTALTGPDTSIRLFADLAKVPDGSGLNHASQQIADFGTLTGRVAQFCVDGDLSCSAPTNAALGRAALTITEQAGADFTRDPVGAANITAQAMSATAASGVAKSAALDWKGDSLSTLTPTGEYSVSERIEQAATVGIRPTAKAGARGQSPEQPTTALEDSMTALVRGGSIGVNSLVTIAGDVLDEQTIGSLIAAGVTGGATSPELTATLTAKAGQSALKLIAPNSLGSRATAIFGALTDGIVDNAELPELIAAARTWDQLTTQDGYKTVPISAGGESVTAVLSDWTLAAARDLSAHAERTSGETTRTSTEKSTMSAPTTTSEAVRPAPQPAPGLPAGPSPTAPYVRAENGSVQAAGPQVTAKEDYALYTASTDGTPTDWGAQPKSVAEASKGLVMGNADFTAAERLAYLADPAYPADSALKQIAVSGGLIPVSHSQGASNA